LIVLYFNKFGSKNHLRIVKRIKTKLFSCQLPFFRINYLKKYVMRDTNFFFLKNKFNIAAIASRHFFIEAAFKKGETFLPRLKI